MVTGSPSSACWETVSDVIKGGNSRHSEQTAGGCFFLSVGLTMASHWMETLFGWSIGQWAAAAGLGHRSDCQLEHHNSVAPNLLQRQRPTHYSDLWFFLSSLSSDERKNLHLSPFCQLKFRWNAKVTSMRLFSVLWHFLFAVTGCSILHPHNQHKWTEDERRAVKGSVIQGRQQLCLCVTRAHFWFTCSRHCLLWHTSNDGWWTWQEVCTKQRK